MTIVQQVKNTLSNLFKKDEIVSEEKQLNNYELAGKMITEEILNSFELSKKDGNENPIVFVSMHFDINQQFIFTCSLSPSNKKRICKKETNLYFSEYELYKSYKKPYEAIKSAVVSEFAGIDYHFSETLYGYRGGGSGVFLVKER